MPNVEELRRRREEEARRRDELLRQERLKKEEADRIRHRQDLERQRWQNMAREKQNAKKQVDIEAAELKSLEVQAALGDKAAQEKLAEIKKYGLGPAPYTGENQS